jgi:hypothetical protein
MKSSLRVDEFENETDQELNQALAELMGEFTPIPEGYTSEYAGSTLYAVDPLRNLEACHQDYTDNWEQLMELSIEHGAFVSPLAWECSPKKYRAKYIALNESGSMMTFGIKYMSDDDDPARALVMTLIKILRSKNNDANTTD